MKNVTLATDPEGAQSRVWFAEMTLRAGLVYFNFKYKNKYVNLGRETLGLTL